MMEELELLSKLKPCPFCGSKSPWVSEKHDTSFCEVCINCDCGCSVKNIEVLPIELAQHKAIAFWNNRYKEA